ncbi:unnamed protein product [Ilex paraguariensis]|uniref:Uncharacterized protein n=1 Tax=Ilex paraguariensis TaxID=185542 RepID=A0ABC8TN46_9AQUA
MSEPWNSGGKAPGLNYSKFCPFHRYPGHDLESCYTLKDLIYDLNDQNRLNWKEIEAHVTGQNQGIYQNPLPDHQALCEQTREWKLFGPGTAYCEKGSKHYYSGSTKADRSTHMSSTVDG